MSHAFNCKEKLSSINPSPNLTSPVSVSRMFAPYSGEEAVGFNSKLIVSTQVISGFLSTVTRRWAGHQQCLSSRPPVHSEDAAL